MRRSRPQYASTARWPVTSRAGFFPTEVFGARRITVERPLRLSFHASDERIQRRADEKALQKLGEAERERIEAACRRLATDVPVTDRDTLMSDLDAALKAESIKPRTPIREAILNAFSERHENAALCTDKKGTPEPDTDLRDHENAPFGESIHDYFERKVYPQVTYAWIDKAKCDPRDGEVGIAGYEIPLNRLRQL